MGSQVHTKFQRNRPNRYQETARGTFMEKGYYSKKNYSYILFIIQIIQI